MACLSVAALLFVAGEFDVNAVVVSETRAGEAPLAAGRPPTAAFVEILTPGVDLLLHRPGLEIRLDYGPRIFWRQPNYSQPDGSSRLSPLILHVANLAATDRSARRVTLTGGASVSAGEADYTSLGQLFGSASASASGMAPGSAVVTPPVGPPQATLPPVTDFLSASARAGAEVEASRIWRLGAKVEVGHRRPLGEPPVDAGGDPVAEAAQVASFVRLRQTNVLAEPTGTVRLTRQDDLMFLTPLSERWFGDGTDIFTVTPQLGWQTRLSPTGGLRLAGGVTYARYQASSMSPLGSGYSFAPVGSADISGVLMRDRDLTMYGSVGAAVDYFVDPILGTAGSRGSMSARWSLLLGLNWTVGIEGSFSTNLRRRRTIDLAPGMTVFYPDETVASASLPVRCRSSENLLIEFGGRWSDRAPNLHAPGFAFHQRQLWAYVMLTFTTQSTSRVPAPTR